MLSASCSSRRAGWLTSLAVAAVVDRRRVLPRRLRPLLRDRVAAGNRRARRRRSSPAGAAPGSRSACSTSTPPARPMSAASGADRRSPPRARTSTRPFAWECAIVKGNPDWLFEGEVFAMKLARRGRRLRGRDGAALPPVQQRPERRPEPSLHDQPGDPVADAGAGVDRRGLRHRRDRLRAGAGARSRSSRRGTSPNATTRLRRRARRPRPPRSSLPRMLSCSRWATTRTTTARPPNSRTASTRRGARSRTGFAPAPATTTTTPRAPKATSAISARRRDRIAAATTASTTGAGISSRSTASSTSPPSRSSTVGSSRISQVPATACARSPIGTIPRSTRARPTAASWQMRPFFDALYAAGVEMVLSGHEHIYERFAPQKADGTADPARGVRQFVVGTGGHELNPIGTPLAQQRIPPERDLGRPAADARRRAITAGSSCRSVAAPRSTPAPGPAIGEARA